MARESLKQVLMRRDQMSEEEADTEIGVARAELEQLIEEEGPGCLCEAEDLIKDMFGLEPDYLDDIMPM